jgi:hypothetical protein
MAPYQRRARVGGEVGPNGEFYRGGAWIATTDAPKAAPRPEPSPEWLAERTAREAAARARAESERAWIDRRVTQFGDLLRVLEWTDPSAPAPLFDSFYQSIARSLRTFGRLTPKQARYAVRAYFDGRTRENEAALECMHDALTTPYPGSAV